MARSSSMQKARCFFANHAAIFAAMCGDSRKDRLLRRRSLRDPRSVQSVVDELGRQNVATTVDSSIPVPREQQRELMKALSAA